MLICILSALALDVELRDPGTLGGEWTEDIQAGTSDSAVSFLQLLGNGMIEQAFALQHAPLQGSSLTRGPQGVALGVMFDTFPFRAPPTNGQGKEENTSFLPAVPRITASAVSGEKLVYGAGVSLVPPITVGGASALIIGGDLSLTYPATEWLRIGVELDGTVGTALAPVVANPDQLEEGVLGNVNPERYEAICAPQAFGCLDELRIRHGGLHLGAAFPVSKPVQPWVRLGARWVDDRFRIEVDLSDWRVSGILPDASAGVNLSLLPNTRIGVGAMIAPLTESVRQNDSPPVLYRFSLGASWVPTIRAKAKG